jgi:hypothetical protein
MKVLDGKASDAIKNMPIEAETEKAKKLLQDVADNLETEASNPRYTEVMKKNMLKSSKKYRELIDNIDDESTEALMARGNLSDKIPIDELKKIHIDKKLSLSLKKIA